MASNLGVGLGIFVAGTVAFTGAVAWAASGSEAKAPVAKAAVAPVASAAAPAGTTDAMASMPGMTATASAKVIPHKLYDPVLPPVGPGHVHAYTLPLIDETFEIAPGVRYSGWTFSGGAPGPVIHVRQGDTVRITLRNDGAIPHSIDFHAARIAPNEAFVDVKPGQSFTYSFVAGDAGVFMYHCGTKPVLAHIANGMYGAIVVDPKGGLPHADRSYVLVASEWYLNGDGTSQPATLDMAKARHMQPDYVTWNGYAGQYKDHPLVAEPGEKVRFYIVSAGPSFDTDFHVVGTLLDTVWLDGTTRDTLHDVQTQLVPAGGGMVFDTHFDAKGLYPVVSHSFASVDLGQVGLVNVGGVAGTMSH